MRKLFISDVTLKELSSQYGLALSFKEKLDIAKCIDKLGYDAIILPPLSGAPSETLLTRTIASTISSCKLAVCTGYSAESVEKAWASVSDAKKPALCVSVPVSSVQMEYVCHKKPENMLSTISELVKKAASLCTTVYFRAEDATRCPFDYLCTAIQTAIEAGACRVTVCDSAGVLLPSEFSELINNILIKVPALKPENLSVECSNTLALSAACAVTAVISGCGGIETSTLHLSGTYIEDIVKIIEAKGDSAGIRCDIVQTELNRTVKQISRITNSDRNSVFSPIVNGIAQAEKDSFTLSASDGIEKVQSMIHHLGYDLTEEDNAKVFEAFKNVAEKKNITERDLEAIISSAAMQVPPTYKLISYSIMTGNQFNATANVVFEKAGQTLQGVSCGNGPIDAAFLAIEQIVGRHLELDDFQIQSVTEGREAMGSALIRLRSNGRLYPGNGISTDIIGASIGAYLNALNKISFEEKI